MRKRTKRVIKEIAIQKITSTIIVFAIVALYGLPIIHNIGLTLSTTLATLIKDFYLRRHFNNLLAKDVKAKELYEANKKKNMPTSNELLPSKTPVLDPNDELVVIEKAIYEILDQYSESDLDDGTVIHIDFGKKDDPTYH